MFAFFQGVVRLVATVINFVVNTFAVLLVVIQAMVKSLAWLIVCLGYLPAWLVAFLLVPISLAVLFQVVNKGS